MNSPPSRPHPRRFLSNQDYARGNHVCHVLHGVAQMGLTLEPPQRRILLETFAVKAD